MRVADAITISPVKTETRSDLGIRAGDTVRVYQKIQEKGKTRLQMFEGAVLFRKHNDEAGGTFTVRRIASGVGVEKTFPLYSPNIEKIEITRRSKVRRAKLYYIREKVAREIRRQMRRMQFVNFTTETEIDKPESVQEEETTDAPESQGEAAPEEAPKGAAQTEVPGKESQKEMEGAPVEEKEKEKKEN